MRSQNRSFVAAIAAAGMLCMILDSKTALDGAVEGVDLCIRSIVPSLFPFLVLSVLLTGALSGTELTLLRPVSRLCGIPAGNEQLLVVGFLGGYPVGAQSICSAYTKGLLSKWDAQRMLGFCSNAGPAFIFGITANKFSTPAAAWLLWAVHIASALLVGILLPGKSTAVTAPKALQSPSVSDAVRKGVYTISIICGWVVLFRILITFCNRWILWLLPRLTQISITGMLELVNGCNALMVITSEGLRFLLCCAFLGFGGLCVAMQTVSVTAELGTGLYFPGKVLQLLISLLLGYYTQLFFFSGEEKIIFAWFPAVVIALICTSTLILWLVLKKTVAFPNKVVYTE